MLGHLAITRLQSDARPRPTISYHATFTRSAARLTLSTGGGTRLSQLDEPVWVELLELSRTHERTQVPLSLTCLGASEGTRSLVIDSLRRLVSTTITVDSFGWHSALTSKEVAFSTVSGFDVQGDHAIVRLSDIGFRAFVLGQHTLGMAELIEPIAGELDLLPAEVEALPGDVVADCRGAAEKRLAEIDGLDEEQVPLLRDMLLQIALKEWLKDQGMLPTQRRAYV